MRHELDFVFCMSPSIVHYLLLSNYYFETGACAFVLGILNKPEQDTLSQSKLRVDSE